MNRQQRRLVQRQGEAAGDGLPAPRPVPGPAPVTETEERPPARPVVAGPRRTSPRQFMHEVNVELRKVVWPDREETANYSTVVFIALAVLMAFIFLMDLGFSHLANYLFK